MLDIEHSSALPSMKSMVEQAESSSASKKRSQLSSGPLNSSSRSPNSEASSIHGNIQLQRKDCESTSNITAVHGLVPNTAHDGPRKSIDRELYSSSQLKVSDSMECIEKEYVLVNAHSTVIETFSYHLETSLQVSSTTRASRLAPKPNEQDVPVMQTAELAASTVGVTGSSQNQGSVMLHTSGASTMLREVQGLSTLHPSTRLHLLHQYIQVLSELSQEKHDAGLFLESFSVELVVLAIWKKAFEICSAWLNSGAESEPPGSISANESKLVEGGAGLSPNTEEHVDFSRPSSVSTWAEQAFIVAFNRAEKLSYHIQAMDGVAQMPDAMEIIFRKALSVGTSGAVDEFENKESAAAAAYTKAILLLSFIAGEAPSLPINPQFVLTSANKSRIQQYIKNLQSHQTNLLKSQASLKQSLDAPKK
nr:serine/threonine-protein kinase ATG1a-like [Ziziphus jujuba var. spinosa]